MKKSIQLIMKIFFLFIITLMIFMLVHRFIGEIGRLPSSLMNAFEKSFFVKNGLFWQALITLTILVFIQLIISFRIVEKGMRQNKYIKGLLFGIAFGILWFFGFLELSITYHDNIIVQVQNGIRDFISLVIFGLLSGILLGTKSIIKDSNKKNDLLVIPFTAISFAIFHGAQYYLTNPALDQSIKNIYQILWLLSTGGWIGFMYMLLKPQIKNFNPILNSLFFAVIIIGIDWFFYNAFFNLWLDIPVFDLVIRQLFSTAGITVGLISYEYFTGIFMKKNRSYS